MKLTQLDSAEIPRYTYNEDNRAIRVEVINGKEPFGIAAKVPEGHLNIVEHHIPIIETKIERIEVPVIVKELEIKEIEKQVIIKEQEINIIKVPEYITKIEYKTIEVPIVIKEKEIVYIDKINFKMLFIAQAITLGLIIASKLIK